MGQQKLRTALIGVDTGGQLFLEAASGTDYFQIAAVADRDGKAAEAVAERYECAAYDDYRRLIIQNEFDCLLVAAGLHSCDEHVRAAMRKKCNVLKAPPMARAFEEAAGFAQLAADEDVKFAVANPERFSKSFLALRTFLGGERIEHVLLVTAFCSVAAERRSAWQSDPKLAGGGILLYDCYEIIDQIVSNFGLAEVAYSLVTNTAGDRQQRLSLTEDMAVVTLRFADGLVGNVIASRHCEVGAEQEILRVYGKNTILKVGNNRFSVSDGCGQIEEKSEFEDDMLSRMKQVLENFALSIISPDENELCSSGAENLSNMAVIEAAYLSARTGMPEEPGRILQMAGDEIVNPAHVRPGQ